MRHRQSLRPINRIKHVVDASATQAAAAVTSWQIATAVDAPALANSEEVITGSTINGVYVKFEIASNDAQVTGAIPNVYLAIWKNPGNNLTLPAPNAIGISDEKRFCIHQEMVMIQNVVSSNPRILFNGVIKIPKGYRRFGPKDKLTAQILSPAIDISACMQAHYKEFR